MVDESLYSTSNEAALAVVATSMKKARLSIEVLIINSLMGGILFSSGGILFVIAESNCPGLRETNRGLLTMIQGCLYPIGLFYVVITGTDLFNSNILFFSVGLVRGAVSILDLAISWFVSYWGNLVANIFVSYIFCKFTHIGTQESFINGSIDALKEKASFSFTDNLIKGMGGNFFVCLGIYLQLMTKPLHVKFLMLLLPIFTFVTIGFTHSVADMYIVIIGLVNHAPISVGTTVWKIMLPGALGNIIGGAFFGVVIPWYLHMYTVERDQRKLNLPEYEATDEQPQLNSDSRVVRKAPSFHEEYEDQEVYPFAAEKQEFSSLNSEYNQSVNPPQQLVRRSNELDRLSKMNSRSSGMSRFSTTTRYKSPRNVFPVYGMAPGGERERSIASGLNEATEEGLSIATNRSRLDNEDGSATYIGDYVKKLFSERNGKRKKDIESQNPPRNTSTRSLSNPLAMNDKIFQKRRKELGNAGNIDTVTGTISPTETVQTNTQNKDDAQLAESSKISQQCSSAQSIKSERLNLQNLQTPVQYSTQSSFNVLQYQPQENLNK